MFIFPMSTLGMGFVMNHRSYVALQSLIASCTDAASVTVDTNIRLVGLFDHEECGSASAQGAASNMMQSVLARLNKQQHLDLSMRRSFLVSADMAHAHHPNYADKHEDAHRVAIHGGLVFKENSNQRYASNAVTTFLLAEIARRYGMGRIAEELGASE